MSLGLPSHLATRSSHDVRVYAGNVISLTLLGAVFVILLQLQAADAALVLWPAMLATAVFLGKVLLVLLAPSVLLSISYLIVGAAATYPVVLLTGTQLAPTSTVTLFILIATQSALVLVGGVGKSMAINVAWPTAGWLLAEAVTRLAWYQAGVSPVVVTPALLAYLLLIAVIVLDPLARRRGMRAQPSLHRAVRDQAIAALRDRIEIQASAMVHDTVLNQLAAIGAAPLGPISSAMRSGIEGDLSLLIGEEWLADPERSVEAGAGAGADWERSELFAVIRNARGEGLDIDVAGDLRAAGALGPARAKALGLAVEQALTNVRKHSGVDRAEIVIYGSDTDVTVMVMDSGVGFSEGQAGGDRLGLRNSIRRRIELVGGTVQLWSEAGAGTSVVIQLPHGSFADDSVASLSDGDQAVTRA